MRTLCLLCNFFVIMCIVPNAFQGLNAQAPFGNAGAHTGVMKNSPSIPFGYYEYLPTDFNPNDSKVYPLVLFYHGLGEKGNGTTQLSKLLVTGVPKRIEQGNHFDAIIISPQSGSGWFSSANFLTLYDYITNNYPVDTNRVYVTGLSAGGGSTWNALNAHYDKIAAAVPICGAGRVQDNASVLQQTPIWAHHNFADMTVTIGQTINNMNRIAFIESSVMSVYPYGPNRTVADGDYTMQFNTTTSSWSAGNGTNPPKDHLAFTLYKNGGHDAWTKTYNNQDVWNWLFAQNLNSQTLSSSNISANKTLLFPNPTTDKVTLNTNSDSKKTLEVYNLIGQKINSNVFFRHFVLDMSQYPPSTYFLKLIDNGKEEKFKLLLSR